MEGRSSGKNGTIYHQTYCCDASRGWEGARGYPCLDTELISQIGSSGAVFETTEPRTLLKHPRPKSQSIATVLMATQSAQQMRTKVPESPPCTYFGKRLLSVDDDRSISMRALHPAPFTARKSCATSRQSGSISRPFRS